MNKKFLTVLVSSLTVLALALGVMAFTQSPVSAASVAEAGLDEVEFAHRKPGGKPGGRGGADPYLAEVLGISEDDLQAAYEAAREAAFAQAEAEGLIPADGEGKRPRGEKMGVDLDAYLAEELGISVDELEAARQAAHQARIEQAISDGDLTQEEADLMEAMRDLQANIDKEAIMAQALGISVEELQAAREAGTPMSDLLEEQDLTKEDLRAAQQAAFEEAVVEAVDDGVITRGQADQILSGEGLPGPAAGGPGGPGGKRGPDGRDSKPGLMPGDSGEAPAPGVDA